GVKGKLAARALLRRGDFLLVSARHDEAAAPDLKVLRLLAGAPRALVHRGDQDLADVLERAEAVNSDAVADLAGEASVERVHGGDHDRDVRVLDRARVEERARELVLVVVALEVRLRAV